MLLAELVAFFPFFLIFLLTPLGICLLNNFPFHIINEKLCLVKKRKSIPTLPTNSLEHYDSLDDWEEVWPLIRFNASM